MATRRVVGMRTTAYENLLRACLKVTHGDLRLVCAAMAAAALILALRRTPYGPETPDEP